jgi:hypothetical protein
MPGQPDIAPSSPSYPQTPGRPPANGSHQVDRANTSVDVHRYSVPKSTSHLQSSPPHVPSPPWIATNPQTSTSSTASSVSNGDASVKRKRKHDGADGPDSPKDVIAFEVDPSNLSRTTSKPQPPPHRSTIHSNYFVMSGPPQPPQPHQQNGHSPRSPHRSSISRSSSTTLPPVLPAIRDSHFLNNTPHPRLPPPPSANVAHSASAASTAADDIDRRPSPSAPASVRKVKLLVKGSRDSI